MTAETTAERRYEVVVVGGGAAGLSGALTLARARRSVLVVDSGHPRNAPADAVHAYLGRDGTPPGELLAIGRAEVTGYGGEIRTGTVTAAERTAEGFRVVLDDGSVLLADRLLIATGLTDELPRVPGLAERFGRDVVHCPYCHGWEARDKRICVLATGPLAVHQALLWRQLSKDVTFFAAEPLDAEDRERLAARDVTVVEERVTGLEVTEGRLTGVRLANGEVVPCDALAVGTRMTARAEPFAGLGIAPVEQEMAGHSIGAAVAADPSGATNVPGVWVAGNVTGLVDQVIGAAAAGVRASAMINADLVAEETRRAVEARRSQVAEDHWNTRYRESERIWSGDPNPTLPREVAGLPPGRALDLGCGEGGDAIWLARQGWHVTAVDISGIALERAFRQADAAGVSDRIDWQRHDLGLSFPEGSYDLVSTHFLHSFVDMPRERILRTAADAVAPGGTLLVVGHTDVPGLKERHPDAHLPASQEVLAGLDLEEGRWEVEVCETHERARTVDGEQVTYTDNTVKARRLP
jgi:thioredoxin reductase/SAM-dependent methyltransferase